MTELRKHIEEQMAEVKALVESKGVGEKLTFLAKVVFHHTKATLLHAKALEEMSEQLKAHTEELKKQEVLFGNMTAELQSQTSVMKRMSLTSDETSDKVRGSLLEHQDALEQHGNVLRQHTSNSEMIVNEQKQAMQDQAYACDQLRHTLQNHMDTMERLTTALNNRY